MGGCLGVAMHLLGWAGWLSGCCYAVARMHWLVARVFAMDALGGC